MPSLPVVRVHMGPVGGAMVAALLVLPAAPVWAAPRLTVEVRSATLMSPVVAVPTVRPPSRPAPMKSAAPAPVRTAPDPRGGNVVVGVTPDTRRNPFLALLGPKPAGGPEAGPPPDGQPTAAGASATSTSPVGTGPSSVAAAVRPLLRAGARGESVRELQRSLVEHGWAIEVDGSYGRDTAGAVTAFQQRHALTVDGITGPQTWAAVLATS